MGFTCILQTDIAQGGRYWNVSLCRQTDNGKTICSGSLDTGALKKKHILKKKTSENILDKGENLFY